MKDNDLVKALAQREACVVHFSHHANMREGGLFPKDLQEAIAHHHKWNLSCCVLWPDHDLDLPGSVGVIFEVRTVTSVISICDGDAGAYQSDGGDEFSGGVPLSEESFESTFGASGPYNEWRISGAQVKGIFVNNVHSIQAKKRLTFLVNGELQDVIASASIALTDVFDAFPNLPIYTMGPNGLEEVSRPT
jgi:hypothetical protein